jgi:hypothetical protein
MVIDFEGEIMEETPIKIALAAEKLEVTPKTIYNWIANELLGTTSPGYVMLSAAKKAKAMAEHQKTASSQMRLLNITRDERGRFVFLDDKTAR